MFRDDLAGGQIGDFAEVLSDHDLLGDEDSDLIQLLRGRDRAASGTGLIDPRAEIARLEEVVAQSDVLVGPQVSNVDRLVAELMASLRERPVVDDVDNVTWFDRRGGVY